MIDNRLLPTARGRALRRVLLALMLGCLPTLVVAQPLPTREQLEIFDRADDSQQGAFAALARAGELSLDPESILALARVALDAGQPIQALVLLEPLRQSLSPQDPLLTTAHRLAAAAWAARGEPVEARKAEIAALQAMRERLGPRNPGFLAAVDAFEAAWEETVPAGQLDAFLDWLRRAPQVSAAKQNTEAPVEMTVWYGTNRLRDDADDPARAFGHRVGPLTLGRLTVTIPPDHRPGQIERPTVWDRFWQLDPMRHVVLAEVEEMARAAFAAGCCKATDRLMFIHGYNTDFHEGALRAGQIAHDLEFTGDMHYFSWPSRGTLLGYLSDANNVVATRPALIDYLKLATAGDGRLHIVAHSMGNRYLLEALDFFLRDAPEVSLGHLILAAPDVDRLEFEARFETLRDRARSVTLYTSSRDRALQVSHLVNGRTRAGDASVALRLPGLDTVDATPIEADALGHNYFGDAPQMLAEILGLVRHGWAPGERCSLNAREEGLWEVSAAGCPVDVLKLVSHLRRDHALNARDEARRRRDKAAAALVPVWDQVISVLERLHDKR